MLLSNFLIVFLSVSTIYHFISMFRDRHSTLTLPPSTSTVALVGRPGAAVKVDRLGEVVRNNEGILNLLMGSKWKSLCVDDLAPEIGTSVCSYLGFGLVFLFPYLLLVVLSVGKLLGYRFLYTDPFIHPSLCVCPFYILHPASCLPSRISRPPKH